MNNNNDINVGATVTVGVEMKVLRADEVVHVMTMQFPNESMQKDFIDWLDTSGVKLFFESKGYNYFTHPYSVYQPNLDEPFLVME